MINIYVILTTSSNLVVGLTNLLTMGQAAFYGIGAYVTALALMVLGFSFLPALILAMLVTGILSLAIGIMSLRLKGDYFVLATLGFQMIIYTLLYNWIAVTKGPYGISSIPGPLTFGVEIKGIYAFLIMSSVLGIVIVFIFSRLINSPFGRALKGLRDDPIGMLTIGKNITKLKIQAFVIASTFAAISGFIYATYITYIDPTSFSLDETLFIISALLIGGTGNIKGPIIGAIIVVLLPEILRFVGLPDSFAANLRMIIYGLCLIFMMFWRPQGIAGDYRI